MYSAKNIVSKLKIEKRNFMFKKIVTALVLVGVANPILALTPDELKEFGLIPSQPSTGKIDATKGNPFELIPIEQNSDSKLTQKENYEDIYIDKAKNYIDEKEYEKAIDFLDKAIVLYPKNSQLYGLRANSYAELNQYEKAVEDYTKAINLDSQRPYSYALRGASYYYLNQYEKAVEDYTKAINLYPQETLFYIARGKAYKELKQDDKMELDLIKARELLSQDNTEEENTKSQNQENDEVYYLNLGIESIDKKKYLKAIELLDKAISLNPQNSDSYYWRGVSYTELKQYQKAITDYSKSISLNPKDAPVYTGRGYAYDALGEYQKAKLDLIKASELYKEAGDIAVYDDIQESLKIVENNITISQQRNQENSEAYYLNIASNLLNEKKNKEAIEFLDKAINLNLRNPDSYYWRGYAYNELKQYQKAIEDLTQSINLNPRNPDSYYSRGYAYNGLKQDQKAIEDLTKSINLNPQNGLYYAVRGNSYNNLYQPQKAKLDYTKAGKLFKQTGDIENYNRIQEALKGTEQNIAILASENASKKRTRELLVKRACSMAKQGYTDGEIRNEIYRLVRINTPAKRRESASLPIGSYGRQIAEIFEDLRENLDDIDIKDEALDIIQAAKKRCKF